MRICFCGQTVWGTDKLTRIGYCKKHQYLRTDTDKRSIIQKAVSKAKTNATQTKVRNFVNTDKDKFVANKALENFEEQEKWFEEKAAIIDQHPYCEECNSFIPKKFYRAATAHALPKRKEFGFPSVATHPDNYMILGAGCGCHGKYDSDWEKAATMKVWNKAVEIFKKLYPFIDKKEYKNIPEVLLQEIEPK